MSVRDRITTSCKKYVVDLFTRLCVHDFVCFTTIFTLYTCYMISSLVDTLSSINTAEAGSAVFTKMPSPHYMEIAMLLLNKWVYASFSVCLCYTCAHTYGHTHTCIHSASEDIPRADEVRALVKDIWDLRLAKLRKSIDQMITQQETYGKV